MCFVRYSCNQDSYGDCKIRNGKCVSSDIGGRGMRRGSIITLALSLVIAGSGCAVLSYVMAGEQKQSVVKTVKNEKNTISDYQKDMGKDENAIEEVGKTTTTDFPIYKGEKDKFTKKTEADMDMEEAVKIAVRKVEEIYGKINITEVDEVNLMEPGSSSDEGKNYDYRAYGGIIKTKENVDYDFTVNSITGEVVGITKMWECDDLAMNDIKLSEKLDKDIEKNKEKYSNIAKKFVKKYTERGKVKKVYDVSSGGISMWKFRLKAATVSCETEDGSNYWIWIYPETGEVIEYNLQYAPNEK